MLRRHPISTRTATLFPSPTLCRSASPRDASWERRSWRASLGRRKFAGEQLAQHVGDGDAALERSDLDLAAQVRRNVDGEPCGEIGGVAVARGTRIGGF